MGTLVDLVRKLYPYNYSVTGPGNDAAAEVLTELLDFKVLEWPSGSELNGWIIPHSPLVERAELFYDGRLVYDGLESPLGVPALSDSFVGDISLDDLQAHLFSDPEYPDSIPHHWANLYRPRESVWGFCMPDRLRKSLAPGDYKVNLVTRREPWSMKALLFELPGESEQSWLFNAHNCHPFQANDDVSGIAVGIELMRRLSEVKKRHYTYQLLIAPELFGPMFWLNGMADTEWSRVRGTVMLKSVGNDRPLRLQKSFDENSVLCRSAMHAFKEKYGEFDSGVFRGVYGNDETVFEAPPYSIPSVTLTRWPFEGYHSDLDTPDRIGETQLKDCVDTAFSIFKVLEMNRTYVPKFRGLPNLSSHGLYSPMAFNSELPDFKSAELRWFRFMHTLSSILGSGLDVLKVSQDFDLPIEDVHRYVMRWVAADLVELK